MTGPELGGANLQPRPGQLAGARIVPDLAAVRSPRRRRWPWVVFAVLLLLGGCGALVLRFFTSGYAEARAVAQAQLPDVLRITSAWDVDLLYELGPDLERETPRSVVRDYFALWQKQLGAAQSLKIAGYYFTRFTGRPTLVTATYDGQFERGTARIAVRFQQTATGWTIVGFRLDNVRPAATSTAPTTGAVTGA